MEQVPCADSEREPRWSESIAVGSRVHVERFRRGLGGRGRFRSVEKEGDTHVLREAPQAYSSNSAGKSAALS